MRIYFMSICGTGMGNAALLLRELGHEVLGSDQNIFPPMSDLLREAGIDILEGVDARRLEALQPDLVVVGNVNTRGNAEVEWLLRERRVRYTSLPAALHELVLSQRQNIVVTGTHGKTTTACLSAFLLQHNARQPGWFIGGVPRDLPGGAKLGRQSDPFVIEGDEYDSAFFDKRSKFIHYAPNILTLNNLEFDHADIFRDLEDVRKSFSHLIRIVPDDGFILINDDEPGLQPLLPIRWTQVLRLGLKEGTDLQIADYAEDAEGSRFRLVWQGRDWADVRWKQWGLFNARNAAMAALAAGLSLHRDDPTRLDLAALAQFQGVKRRQERFHDDGRIVLISDFAHHPTAVAATLRALRARYPQHRLHACFEARSNTTCRGVFQREFMEALSLADRVHLGAVHRADRYAPGQRIDLEALARELPGVALSYGDNHRLRDGLLSELAAPASHAVVFFSNGSFDGIMPEVKAALTAVHSPQS